MAYKKETLIKYHQTVMQKLAEFMAALALGMLLKVSISAGNRKIGRVFNVSLPAIVTCANCEECCGICYDIKACMQYGGTMAARARNLALLRFNRDEYFRQVESVMTPTRKHKYFRWHVGGDIVDMDYFDRMVQIARRHPDWTYWTYTKHYMAVNRWIKDHGKEALPSNLTIMFSEWRGLEMVNPYGMPEFRVVFKDDQYKPDPAKVHYCPGNCDICKAANRGCVAGETTYCMEH